MNELYTDSSISLQVQPTTLSKSGEWVTVTWEGVSSPSKKDWIGVYSPPANNAYGINATKNAPIKYQVQAEFIPCRADIAGGPTT